MKIRIYDRQFPQGKSFGTGDLQVPPTYFEWIRNGSTEITVFTESMFYMAHTVKSKIKVAIILESPAVYDYSWIKNNYDIFDDVFTFDKSLLFISSKFKWYPFGGCWIKPEDWKIYPKTKFCSIIASDKRITEGHKLRWEIIEKYGHEIDMFGRGHNPIGYKLDALKDYKYSIVIENSKCDDMFSEKLIDCFATGTIPIYWGTENIGNYFDSVGIHWLRHIEECFEYQPDNSEQIETNFKYAKQYAIPEDWLWLNYFQQWKF